MIYNVVINKEYDEFFEIITYEVIGETEYVKVGKVRKEDVFPNVKMLMEIQIENDLNDGVIKLC